MKNKNILFCITLVIYGLIVSIEIALSITAFGNRSLTNWYGFLGILITAILLVGTYGALQSKLVCRFFCKRARELKNESPPIYRIEQYVLRWWKYEDPIEDDNIFLDLVDMPGKRSRHPDERQRLAVEKWERIKRHPNGVTLEEFITSEFGITNGVLNISKSTFYGWRRQLKKKAK